MPPGCRLAVAGEALIDLVTSDGVNFVAHVGGGPLNVAVGTARLGLDTAFVGRISTDRFGIRIIEHLQANGVNDRLVRRAPEASSLAIATLDATGSADYNFYLAGTADWQWSDDELPADLAVDALHLGTLAMQRQPSAAVFERLARRVRGQVTVSYDPNVRPSLGESHAQEVARVERQVALADIIKASEDDIRWLYPDADLTGLAHHWIDSGAVFVVITRGADGAIAVTKDVRVERPAAPARVVDTVGAGDSAMAGLLSALADRALLGENCAQLFDALTEKDMSNIVDFALTCASITVSRAGAAPPTRGEVVGAH